MSTRLRLTSLLLLASDTPELATLAVYQCGHHTCESWNVYKVHIIEHV